MSTSFEIGDLVWAKMKQYPMWPAKIVIPPNNIKCPNSKKEVHCVYFYGGGSHGWISPANMCHHNEDMIKKAEDAKAKSNSFKMAIEEIKQECKISCYRPKPDGHIATTSEKSFHKYTSVQPESKVTKKRPLQKSSKSDLSLKSKKVRRHSSDDDRMLFAKEKLPFHSISRISDTLKTKHVTPTEKKIGFLGLGMMGRSIVRNLLNSGHDVTVWNRTADRCEDFIRAGALKGRTAADVVRSCDITFCCVSDASAVQAVVFGQGGVLEGLENCVGGEKGYVEMSSLDDAYSQQIAEAINMKGCRYLEAPLSGSRTLAEEGLLLVLGSGDRSLFNDCVTCFHAISRHAYYFSCDIGRGSQIHLIMSMLAGTVYAAMANSLALLDRMKLPQKEFLEMAGMLGLKSPAIEEKGLAMLEHAFAPNTPLKYIQNDINLGLQMDAAQHMHITSAANELYKHSKLLGYGDHDVSAVYHGARY